MKKIYGLLSKTAVLLVILFFTTNDILAQNTTTQSDFWKKVQFGGGVNLNFGNGFSNIGISPSMLYNVNEYVSVGTGFQVNYTSSSGNYSSLIYGLHLTSLFNLVENIQLSADLEQLKVDTTFENAATPKNSFWNTGLWLGGGYRTNNITIGGRYNVLYNKDKSIYGNAFMPFVRVYF